MRDAVNKKQSSGFSLLEMAVVLIILGFVLGAILAPIQAQRQMLHQSQTENTLEIAKKALLGYAQSQGRLPCPATALSNIDAGSKGLESPLPATGTCTVAAGFLPAATLGIQPTDSSGFVIDAWNNRIRYAVTQTNNAGVLTTHFTTANEMANQGIANLQPNIRVCNSSAVVTATRCSGGTEANYLTNNAVVVIYSTGATGAQGSGSADETANLDNDSVFVSHDSSSVTGNEFDHMMVWISPYVLYNAMIEAGQLH
jgi:prepilin-type N-terminal cleavage/methylation domain-containing protein